MNPLTIKDASFGYGKTTIVENLNLTLLPGEIVLLEGANGSGKTTIMKTLKGEIPLLSGEFNMCNEVSYVPQEHVIVKDSIFSVYDVMQTADSSQWGKLKDKCDNLLTIVGLENFGNRKFGELSGGQRQKVIIARSLINSPKLLLMDEPINHIDKKTKDELGMVLRRVAKDDNCAILLTSHTDEWLDYHHTIALEQQ